MPSSKRVQAYYQLQDAQNAIVEDPDSCYIISHEYVRKDGGIGRHYYTFTSFHSFLRHRDYFPHCHEIMARHSRASEDTSGRLVFDFDLPPHVEGIRRAVEIVIADTLHHYYEDLDLEKIDYVWSQSPSDTKTSLHLTVRGLYFDDWIGHSQVFYSLFSRLWDATEPPIPAEELIDTAVVRHHGSLRMVGSCKIGGSYLTLLGDHALLDSLIWLPEKYRGEEQTVTSANLGPIASVLYSQKSEESGRSKKLSQRPGQKLEGQSLEAFALYEKTGDSQYVADSVRGDIIRLRRVSAGPCLISGKHHDSENAYLRIREGGDVYFCCWRKCGSKYLGNCHRRQTSTE